MGKGTSMKKVTLLVISALFYVGMLLFTVVARKVHEAGLPKVTGCYPEMYSYSDGATSGFKAGIPLYLKDKPLFQIAVREKNGELRYYAELVTEFEVLEEQEEVYLVDGGVNSYQMIISEGMEAVEDGSEVVLLNEEDFKSWY